MALAYNTKLTLLLLLAQVGEMKHDKCESVRHWMNTLCFCDGVSLLSVSQFCVVNTRLEIRT